ncbi:MAG TPA: immunoglobulin domain-containing protein [Verrucomicrobiae bacterium]|nr:immunoglobulin domain-containing protein [Verrucomicrobiae bacterium]
MNYRAAFLPGKFRTHVFLAHFLLLPLVAWGASDPTITTAPQNQSVLAGANAVFTVAATGPGTLTYQWSLNGTNLMDNPHITGATSSTLTLNNVDAADAGTYQITVSNSHGSATTNAVLTVWLPPAVVAGPISQTVKAYDTATFNVSAGGTAPLAYQWQFNGTNLPGRTDVSLVLTNVQAADAGSYAVVVTNLYGSVTSAPAVLTVQLPPVILQQPQAQTVLWGGRATFSVTATGAPPTTFQWYLNGTNLLADETNAVLTLTNVQPAQAGFYSVGVSSPGWVAYSLNAALTVELPPSGVPFITGITPTMASPGAVVTITGTNFNPVAVSNRVFFGAVAAPVLSASASQLTVRAPVGATFGPITVAVGGLVAASDALFEPTFTGSGANVATTNFASSFNLGTGGGPGSCVVADLDGDGKPEIALVTGDNHAVAIFRNLSSNGALLGAASFAARLDLPFPGTGTGGTPYRLRAVDLDGDGRLDLVAAEVNGARVSVFHNLAVPGTLTGSSFEPAFSLATGSDCRFVTAADLDGDGRADLVALNYGAKTISIFHNVGTVGMLNAASFAAPVVLAAPGGPYEATLADLDGDGKPDLAVANSDNNTVSIYPNLATPGGLTAASFAPRIDLPAGINASTIAAVDLDGDGKLDLVVGSVQSNAINVYCNVGGGALTASSFAPHVDFGTPGWMHTVSVADFNGDGKPDIGVVGELPSYMAIFQNASTPGSFTSASFLPRVDFGTGWNAWGIAAGDLDGDGRPDLVFCNAYDANIQIYQNQVPYGGPPTVLASPADVAVPLAATFQLAGAAGGQLPLDYQWRFNGTNLADGGRISGARTSRLSIANAQLADTGGYSFIVTNSLGAATSAVATVTVFIVPPVIAQPPANQTNLVGSNATFTASVTGSEPLSYQWFRAGTALLDGDRISGATTPALTVSNLLTDDAANYWLVASNAAGTATSTVASLTVLIPPAFTLQPVSQITAVGSNVVFSAAAEGSEPIRYQWYLNGSPLIDNARITGALTASLGISNAQTADAGNYTVVAANAGASVTSSNAALAVLVPPSVTTPPVGRSVPCGLPTTFTAAGAGSALTYQWRFNGADIPGATNASYAIAAVGTNDLGGYQFAVSNAVGVAVSSSAWLTFGPVAAWGNNSLGQALPPPGLSNVVAIAGGAAFSLALKGDGTVVVWGGGPVTNVPPGLTNVVAIGAGNLHALATLADGTVVSWGTGTVTNVPATVSNVVAVTGGNNHSLALRREGTVYEWGTTRNIPAPAVGLSELTSIADGVGYSLATRSDGTVVQWGAYYPGGVKLSSDFSLVSGLSNVVAVAAGYNSSLALKADGRVVAWGSYLVYPVQTNVPASLTDVTAIATATSPATQGGGHSLALRSNGQVVAWGLNSYGQTNVPAALSNVVAIAAGSAHSLALVGDGAPVILREPVGGTAFTGSPFALNAGVSGAAPLFYSWSLNGTNLPDTDASLSITAAQAADAGVYQLTVSNAFGVATSVPVPVTVLDGAPALLSFPAATNRPSVGSAFTFTAVPIGSGPLHCQWQFNGQDLAAATNADLPFAPVRMNSGGQYRFIASNAFGAVTSSIATLMPVSVVAWGNSTYSLTNVPASLTNAVAVAAGPQLAAALRADGTVTVWGLESTNIPANVTNVVQVALGYPFRLALRGDGTVATWNVSTAFSNAVAGLAGVVAVEADSAGGTFLKADGTVIRLSSTGETNQYPQLTNVVALTRFNNGFAALRADGTVFTTAGSGIAPPASANSNVLDLALESSYGSVLKRDGTMQNWGIYYNASTNLPGMAAVCANAAERTNGTVLPWAWTPNAPLLTNVPPGLSGVSALDGSTYLTLALLTTRAFPAVLLPDALDTPALVVSSRGSPQWYGQTGVSHDGINAAQSAEIGDNTASSMRLWVAGPLTVSFWWKVSSETNHDFLTFAAGGVVLTNLSGESGWQQCTLTTPPGNQILQWTYAKDGSGSAGQDAAWVDQLILTPVAPALVAQPAGTNVLGGANVTLGVSVFGTPPLLYQWQKDGDAIPGATQAVLSLANVTRTNSGLYSVLVTNDAGNAASSNALLTVRVPQRLTAPTLLPDGTLQLDSADADGGSLSPDDVAHFELQASTNLVDWTTLANGLSFTNGTLLLQDPDALKHPLRFYRVLEH